MQKPRFYDALRLLSLALFVVIAACDQTKPAPPVVPPPVDPLTTCTIALSDTNEIVISSSSPVSLNATTSAKFLNPSSDGMVEVSLSQGKYYLLKPLHPTKPYEGGVVQLQLEQDTKSVCKPFETTLAALPAPDAPNVQGTYTTVIRNTDKTIQDFSAALGVNPNTITDQEFQNSPSSIQVAVVMQKAWQKASQDLPPVPQNSPELDSLMISSGLSEAMNELNTELSTLSRSGKSLKLQADAVVIPIDAPRLALMIKAKKEIATMNAKIESMTYKAAKAAVTLFAQSIALGVPVAMPVVTSILTAVSFIETSIETLDGLLPDGILPQLQFQVDKTTLANPDDIGTWSKVMVQPVGGAVMKPLEILTDKLTEFILKAPVDYLKKYLGKLSGTSNQRDQIEALIGTITSFFGNFMPSLTDYVLNLLPNNGVREATWYPVELPNNGAWYTARAADGVQIDNASNGTFKMVSPSKLTSGRILLETKPDVFGSAVASDEKSIVVKRGFRFVFLLSASERYNNSEGLMNSVIEYEQKVNYGFDTVIKCTGFSSSYTNTPCIYESNLLNNYQVKNYEVQNKIGTVTSVALVTPTQKDSTLDKPFNISSDYIVEIPGFSWGHRAEERVEITVLSSGAKTTSVRPVSINIHGLSKQKIPLNPSTGTASGTIESGATRCINQNPSASCSYSYTGDWSLEIKPY